MKFHYNFNQKSMEEKLDSVKEFIQYQENTINNLLEQNRQLKDEHYKDEELQKMKFELEEIKKELYRGFPISNKEAEDIRNWQLQHEAEVHGAKTIEERLRQGGAIGGKYEYRFIPTSIGTFGEIVCSCGEKFVFQTP